MREIILGAIVIMSENKRLSVAFSNVNVIFAKSLMCWQ